jgi:hypothetical protein
VGRRGPSGYRATGPGRVPVRKALEIIVIMCVHACMSIHTSPQDQAGLLRRRVIVEFTPEQLELLDQAEARHGTKRAGIVAALAAYADPGTDAGAHARTTRNPARASPTDNAPAGADEFARLRTEAQALGDALGAAEAARDEAHAQLRRADDLRVRLEEAFGDAEDALNAKLDSLRAHRLSELYCACCDHWAPADEWSWATDDDARQYAYHGPCGNQDGWLFQPSSWLARRPVPGA